MGPPVRAGPIEEHHIPQGTVQLARRMGEKSMTWVVVASNVTRSVYGATIGKGHDTIGADGSSETRLSQRVNVCGESPACKPLHQLLRVRPGSRHGNALGDLDTGFGIHPHNDPRKRPDFWHEFIIPSRVLVWFIFADHGTGSCSSEFPASSGSGKRGTVLSGGEPGQTTLASIRCKDSMETPVWHGAIRLFACSRCQRKPYS